MEIEWCWVPARMAVITLSVLNIRTTNYSSASHGALRTFLLTPSSVPLKLIYRSNFCRPGMTSMMRLRFDRSEEHTSELQSRGHLVCRLLLEKKKKKIQR